MKDWKKEDLSEDELQAFMKDISAKPEAEKRAFLDELSAEEEALHKELLNGNRALIDVLNKRLRGDPPFEPPSPNGRRILEKGVRICTAMLAATQKAGPHGDIRAAFLEQLGGGSADEG